MLEQRHKEAIKKTMLRHEDIFRQQVTELHRLYKVQKLLTDNIDNPTKQKGISICQDMSNSSFVRRDPQKVGYDIQVQSLRHVNPRTQECTASCSGEPIRISKRFHRQRPAEENMSSGVSVNVRDEIGYIPNITLMETNAEVVENGSDEGRNGTELELTLSIEPNTVMRRPESYKNHCSSGFIKKENKKKCIEGGDDMANSSAILNQETKRPHWLFQDLSLNGT